MGYTILIKNGRVIDPDTRFDGICDLLLKDGVIEACEKEIRIDPDMEVVPEAGAADEKAAASENAADLTAADEAAVSENTADPKAAAGKAAEAAEGAGAAGQKTAAPETTDPETTGIKTAEKPEPERPYTIPGADRIIDASGCYVMPGLIDMHVHLRDPGLTQKEDINSGARAAAAGGFTTIVAMPNTKPVIDSPDRVDYVTNKAHNAPVHVLQAGAVTKGQKGKELSDIAGMKEHGIPAISEDGKSVMNAQLCKEALKVAAELNIPFLDHCEDANLVHGGCVNEDTFSEKEGVPGIGNEVEDVIIARDIMLADKTGAHLHLCHCSTEGSYEMLKRAKERGNDVSGEVCPHHFTLVSADRIPGDTNYKMNPPVRSEKDRAALIKGLREDVFEVIATDHAPHTRLDKAGTLQEAAFGIVGLETAVSLTISELVAPGILTPMQMAEKMSSNPARILHLENRGSLAPGKEADVVIIDPAAEYVIDPKTFASKGKNTPFGGRKVQGVVMYTVCGGQVVYEKRD